MNVLDIIVLIISFLSIFIGLFQFLKIFILDRKKHKRKQKVELNIINLDKDNNLKSFGVLKNEFTDFQNPEDFKILNSGRDLCTDERLIQINVVDYCNHIIIL